MHVQRQGKGQVMAFPITIEDVQYSAASSLVRLEEDDVVLG